MGIHIPYIYNYNDILYFQWGALRNDSMVVPKKKHQVVNPMIFTIRQALKGASKATKTTKEQDDLEALFTVDTKGSETR